MSTTSSTASCSASTRRCSSDTSPAIVLHDLLGDGISAEFLSSVYLWFLPLVPLALAVWLVWSRNLAFGYWFATSQCLAWTLGTVSYYALPTLGPGFQHPWLYQTIDDTNAGRLMNSLANSRVWAVQTSSPSLIDSTNSSVAWPASPACTWRSPCWSR